MLKKSLRSLLLLSCVLSSSLFAEPATPLDYSLTVVNNTDMWGVIKIESTGQCSYSMGYLGKIPPHRTVELPALYIKMYCNTGPNSCTGDFYLTADEASDCQGTSVGNVTYISSGGVISQDNGRVTVNSPTQISLN